MEENNIKMEENEAIENNVPVLEQENSVNDNNKSDEKSKNGIYHWIFNIVLLIAVIVLYILHFCCGGSSKKQSAPIVVADNGTGETVYINIDSVNANYELVSILNDSIDVEKQKQAVTFQNRQKALEQKLANYQNNVQSGSLTPQQAQYAEQSLQEESMRLQSDYSQAMESFEIRYAAALQQITDSLIAATNRVNETRNASYVFVYQTGGPLLVASPAHDITSEVLDELNKSFKKKKK